MDVYAAVSLLNYFFCDRAIIDKTLFYEIYTLVYPEIICQTLKTPFGCFILIKFMPQCGKCQIERIVQFWMV